MTGSKASIFSPDQDRALRELPGELEALAALIARNQGRGIEQKRAFYRRVLDDLHAQLGLWRADMSITPVEAAKENWSFGNGEAPYVG